VQGAAVRSRKPYTILSVATSVLVSVPIRTGLDVGIDKFQPLGMIGVDLNGIAVREDSPYRTLKEFIDAARARPKSITVAVGSIGATAHYFIYQLERMTGARFNVVSMKSGAEAMTAVLGGHVQATAENLGESMPFVETKKMLLLGVPA
jgi:tripartite-type tricarboxylate transporter receptor subunit TctC